jgi:hypothetical protein
MILQQKYDRNLFLGRYDPPRPAQFEPVNAVLQGYQRAGLVTSDELALIKRVDRQTRPKIESILVTDGPQYALLYLTLLKKIERVDTMQSILVLIGDALQGSICSFRLWDMPSIVAR